MVAVLKRWYGPYAQANVWKESLHLLADLAIGIGLFTAVVTMLSLSLGLMITLIGLPLLIATVLGGRALGVLERARVRALLDVELSGFAPIRWTGNLWQRARTGLTDQPGWKGLVYGALMLPWGIITFTLTLVVWSVAWSMAVAPLWSWTAGDPPPFDIDGVTYNVHGWWLVPITILVGVLGWLMVAALPRIIHGLATADAALARALLSPNSEQELAQRVSELEVSREASVESSASELRRIERDLHDGAQQRLVSLAMNLGMAKDRLRESDDDRAKEMVSLAHDEAKQAISELRDLVRGIHPAVLTDRGLDAAVSALVARCPVPVTLHTDLPRRLPSAVEATAYFVVAEALTNVAKHSRARTAMVRLVERDGLLFVEVHDDGVGGATDAAGGGLRGLRDRVTGVEGRLRIASPEGGPTVLSVELPCAS
ncbi:MAG: sensor domain-containing protein [Ilumatobacteraceae bacterium]